jgi:hypothetical protein
MGRWTDYYLDDDFDAFWGRRVSDPDVRVLTILGLGFDPRCLLALKSMTRLGLGVRLGYIALKLIARPAFGKSGIVTEELAKANFEALLKLEACRSKTVYEIETHDAEGHNVAGRKTLSVIGGATEIL